MQNEIKYIDLFGGVGGFRLGIERAFNNESKRQESENVKDKSNTCSNPIQATTLNCVFYSDIDKYAVQTYNKNFGENHEATDIRTIEADSIPDFDMLCGGFPCQSFSIAGKRRGFEDTRGTLFFEVARIIKAKRPKIVFLENVKGLLNHDKGNTFRTIIQTISELGYDVQWMVLNSKFFGVPQNRERVFIIGSLRGEPRPEILPFGKDGVKYDEESTLQKTRDISKCITARYWKQGQSDQYINDIQCFQKHKSQHSRVYETEGISPTLAGASKLSGDCTPKIRAVLTPARANKRQNGKRMKENGEPSFTLTGQDVHGVAIMDLYNHTESSEICPTLKDPCHNDRRVREFQPAQLVNKNRAKKPYNPDDREMKIKVRDDDTSYTVKSATHEFMVKQKMRIRRLTPIEYERLQGFPDNWTEGVSDTQRYKQMGNAVTVNVIQAIAEKLLK